MGRKKKIDKEKEEQESDGLEFDIAGDAKRSLAAVFLFALALVIILGFFEKAGIVGEYLSSATAVSIGWVKWVFPIFLIMAGVILLLRKETSFYIVKLVGLLVTFFSLTAFLHWFFDAKEMKEVAYAGSGGGYVGYAMAYASVKFLGKAGGFVVIAAFFLVGIIVAFNFSIRHFIEGILRKYNGLKRSKAEDGTEEDAEDIEDAEEDEPQQEEEISEDDAEKDDEDGNIGKVEFADGVDQFVDERLTDKISSKVSKAKKALVGNREEEDWEFPSLDLLEKNSSIAKGGDIEKNAEIIQRTLRQFGIEVERGGIQTGPSVTQFSFRPPKGESIIVEEDGQVVDISSGDKTIDIKIETKDKAKTIKEYQVPLGSVLRVEKGDLIGKGSKLTDGNIDLKKLYKAMGWEAVHRYIVKEIQEIYASQGEAINDKHVEVIIKQMFSRMQVTDAGDTSLMAGDIVEKDQFREVNEEAKAAGKKEAEGEELLLGITKVALSTESFLSAASFQETARVLINAAVEGKVDHLRGLKENVIIGKLIPAGTGYKEKE